MCSNLRPINDEEAIVYKIVAKKKRGTRYYSLAMGFKYPKVAGSVPEVKHQCSLGYFHNRILLTHYRGGMIKRTAGFINRRDAELLAIHIRSEIKAYVIKVVKAKLTNRLMSGHYEGDPIIAGKHIEFLE